MDPRVEPEDDKEQPANAVLASDCIIRISSSSGLTRGSILPLRKRMAETGPAMTNGDVYGPHAAARRFSLATQASVSFSAFS